jgi:hypothetical protein
MSEAEDASAVGARRGRSVIYLHIGAPKTGTTYLQNILWRNRHALREDGFLYPGEHYLAHTHAALNLREIHGEHRGYMNPAVPGAWQRLVDEARNWDGTVLVSQELFSPAEPAQIERAMTTLDFADVHLIYTARDLVRQVPAAWQEDLKNRKTMTFAEFLESLQAPAEQMHRLARIFWRMQDAADVLGRWAHAVPPDRVHLITLPQPATGDDTLWTRFCEVTGIDAGRYDTIAAAANQSLGVAEANLLLRLNLALDGEIRWPVYSDSVTGLVAIDVLGARPNPRKIILPPGDRAWIAKRAEEMVEELRTAKYHVVGDLDDLTPSVDTSSAADSTALNQQADAPDAEMVDAAVESMAALVARLQQRRDEIDLVNAELDRQRTEQDVLRTERDTLRQDVARLEQDTARLAAILAKPPAKLFVIKLSEQNRAVMRARIVYWNIAVFSRKVISKISPGRAHGR